MGTQAGEAARVEPHAHGSRRHEFRAGWGATPSGALRHPVRHHSGRRHTAASRSRNQAGRHDGPSSQSAKIRSAVAACRRWVRSPPASNHAGPARPSRTLTLPAHLVGPFRNRSVRVRGVGCLSGLVWRGIVCREGDLRRGGVRGESRGSRPRERSAEPRSIRGSLRAGGVRGRHRTDRKLPVAVRGRCRTPASLGPR